MTQPRWPDRPTGLQRRRARRIAPLAAQLEPDVELYDDADDADQPPDAAEQAPGCVLTGDRSPAAVVTAQADQGQRDGFPMVEVQPTADQPTAADRWQQLQTDVEQIIADVDAVLAAFDADLARSELRRQLDQV